MIFGFYLGDWITERVLELVVTAYDLVQFGQDAGYIGPPFRWNDERRLLLRCELDAAYFHLYSIERDDVEYIMDTFPIVRRKEEEVFGEYRTKRVILEIYDEMAEAMRTGQPYQTRLDPPPGDPRAAHPWDEEYLGPYKPPEEWWKEVEMGKEGVPVDASVSVKITAKTIREPVAALELKSPPAAKKKKKPSTTKAAPQRPLLDVSPAPGGPRNTRLRRAMDRGKDDSPTATRELVAFLADEDSSIQWLAGSLLMQRASLDVVEAVGAFLKGAEPERADRARPEAHKLLELLAETAEDEAVREAAQSVLH